MRQAEKKTVLMQLKEILQIYQFILLAILILAIGVLLVALAERLPSPEIARDIGVALLTAGTVGLALEFFTRKQFQDLVGERMAAVLRSSDLGSRIQSLQDLISLGTDLRPLGVTRVYKDRTEINLRDFLAEAAPKSEIRVLGIALMGFSYFPMQQCLENLLRDGCKIWLLTLDPQSEFVKQRGIEERRVYEHIKTDIGAADQMHRSFITQLPQPLQEKIELGHYDAPPAYFIVSTGSTMIVGFYLRGIRGERSPHLELEIREGGICKPFLEHFDSLWTARLS